MTEFILNNQHIVTELLPTTVLLDFLRKEKKLTGTKEGCREGDCGACTVLLGELTNGAVKYKSVNSCLMPLGDVQGKHVVTIEGLNREELSPIQSSMVDEGGTQCGFCTPGFIISMTGYFLNAISPNLNDAIEALGGNICRCTGYAGIKRATEKAIVRFENGKAKDKAHLEKLISQKFIPEYFTHIKKKLQKINRNNLTGNKIAGAKTLISGGTDLYVQQWENLVRSNANLISGKKNFSGISVSGKKIKIGSATTIEEIRSSKILQKYFPQWSNYLNLFGSLPIRNRATIGGNIVNASPIGDMINILLGLDAEVHLQNGKKTRSLPLKNFYKGYKTLSIKKNEIVEAVGIKIPAKNSFFNYEKVSKRTYLDIASVNSSIYLEMKRGKISAANLSAGGVAPIPFYLNHTCKYLLNKNISEETIKEAVSIAMSEISPISDARGSAKYKRLLLRQLIYAHFIKLFPQQINPEKLL